MAQSVLYEWLFAPYFSKFRMTDLLHEIQLPWYVQQCIWLSIFSLGKFSLVFKDKIKLSCDARWVSFWLELLELHWFEGNRKLVSSDQGEPHSRLVCCQKAGGLETGLKVSLCRVMLMTIWSHPLALVGLFHSNQLGAECWLLTVTIVCGRLLFRMQWSICSELSKAWKKIHELPSLLLEWAILTVGRLESKGSHSLKHCWEINWLREYW